MTISRGQISMSAGDQFLVSLDPRIVHYHASVTATSKPGEREPSDQARPPPLRGWWRRAVKRYIASEIV